MMVESRSMLFGEESGIRLALLAKKQRKESVAGCEDWENVYSYEEKRLKSIVDEEGYHKWEKKNRLWEIENHLLPIVEDWEKEYSYEEKRLKSLVDEDGYYKWEKQNWLWEIDNHRVPEEHVSPEEEITRKNLRFILSLSLPLQDPKKAQEKFDKGLKELHTKVLTQEEKRLKDSYLEKMENSGPYYSKEPFFPFGPGWDLAYRAKCPEFRTLQSLPRVETEKIPPTTLMSLLHKPTEGCTTPVISREEEREILAAQGRCLDGWYLTPYCKCNKHCYRFDTVLKEHPPECLPIWLAYCRQFRQSHCFDIDDYIGGTGCPVALSRVSKGGAEIMMKLANRAIQEYNKKECNVFKYKVLKIEKVNTSVGMYYTYWMTVKVLNLTVGSPIETFQIHAGTSYVNNDEVIYCCRPKEEAIISLPICKFCFGLCEGRNEP